MAVQSVADAGFFSLVHEVLEAEKKKGPAERRDGSRSQFDCMQLIAPYTEGRMPLASEFRSVRCNDISPGGISYLTPTIPEHRQILVLLGPAPFILLKAEVAHHKPIVSEGRTEYLIGCRFTGRLKC